MNRALQGTVDLLNMKLTVLPVFIRALESVHKSLSKRLKELEIREKSTAIKTTTLSYKVLLTRTRNAGIIDNDYITTKQFISPK